MTCLTPLLQSGRRLVLRPVLSLLLLVVVSISAQQISGGGGGGAAPAPPYFAYGAGSYIFPAYLTTVPIFGAFSWENQGSATAAALTSGAIYILGGQQNGESLSLFGQPVPVTSTWTVTIAFIPQLVSFNYENMGIACRNSSNGKVQVLRLTSQNSSTPVRQVTDYTNYTTYSSDAAGAPPVPLKTVEFFQVHWDGTNISYSWSSDGQKFYQQFSEAASTGFLGAQPTTIGPYVNGNDTGSSGGICAMTLLSYTVGL